MHPNDITHKTAEEVTVALQKQIDGHRELSHKCMDYAYELVILVQSAPTLSREAAIEKGMDEFYYDLVIASGQTVQDTKLVHDWLDKLHQEHRGEPIPKDNYDLFLEQIFSELDSRQGAHSICAAWHWGHVLEHLLAKDVQ